MSDYFNLLKEYQELQINFQNQKDNINTIAYYVQSFGISISSLLQCSNSDDPLNDESLLYFTHLYKNLIKDLKESNLFNFDILLPLQQMDESQNDSKNRIFNLFNEIKSNLVEAKQKLNNAKKDYFDFIKENKDIINSTKGDDNLLYEAKKQNYFILYKYELDKLNEKIIKNNQKYNIILDELESMNMHKENTYSKALIEFGKIVGSVGKKFIEFEKNVKEKFSRDSSKNLIQNKNLIIQYRFQKEEMEYEQIEDISGNNNANNNLNKELLLIPNNIDNNHNNPNKNNIEIQNNNIINNIVKNNNIEKSNIGFDFEILEEPITSEEAKINTLMDEIIQKLTSEEEITPTEISELFEKSKYDYSKFSHQFLKKIKTYYQNRVISCKNKQNFVHLSNIINNLTIKKDDNEIFNEIIEVSKMIKYEDVFMSSMIQKNNPFLSSKTFWMNLIENNFISELNIQSAKLLKTSIKALKKEAKSQKIEQKKKLEKKEDIPIFLNTQVYGYKKLSKKQKPFIEQNITESIILIISQAVSNMCYFLVSEQCILDIISHYSEIFDLGIESFYYFKNMLSVKFQKKYLKMNQNYEEYKEKYGYHMTSNEIILLNASKFLPKENYINIFRINKDINLKIRKNLLKYELTKFDIPINERIKIWEIVLNIKEIKKKYNYNEIKNRFSQMKLEKDSPLIKKLSIIDLDLGRTPLFRENEMHNKTACNILKCIGILENAIDYYQGMNFMLLFLYQILDYDEEKTFYFFLALEKNTKYHELFDNELSDLVIFFKVFEKILEINLPDLYYSLLDKQIMTQFYSTSWFVTIFTSEVIKFKKEEAPKFILMAFEGFLFGGWSGIINSGLSLLLHNKDKILNYDGNELMRYMIAELNNINNISEEDFEKMHKSYLNSSEKINESCIKKLIDIIKFENQHKQLKGKEI